MTTKAAINQAIARKKSHKRKNIEKNNLGRKKLKRRRRKQRQRVRAKIYKATHKGVDKAQTIVVEDLSVPIKERSYGQDQNRTLSGWVKGLMASALESVQRRRGSTLFSSRQPTRRKWIPDTVSF